MDKLQWCEREVARVHRSCTEGIRLVRQQVYQAQDASGGQPWDFHRHGLDLGFDDTGYCTSATHYRRQYLRSR